MKFIVFGLLLQMCLLHMNLADSGYDGKPGCKTPEEVGRVYRNFWDPSRYWRCVGLNMEAQSESCPSGYAFLSSISSCVPWFDWVWQPETYPPSCPDGVVCVQSQPLPLSIQKIV